MEKKKGKKPGGQRVEQATGGQPEEKRGSEGQAGPSQPSQQQKKHVEPALRSGGGDVTAGPSFQPQGQRRKWQPRSQRQHPHVPGMKGEWEGPTGYRPGVPPPHVGFRHETGGSVPQFPETQPRHMGAWGRGQQFVGPAGQSEYRPGVPPPHVGLRHETGGSVPQFPETQPREMGAWGRGQKFVGPGRGGQGKHHKRGQPPSQKFSEGRGPKGSALPRQAQSSSPAPSEYGPPSFVSFPHEIGGALPELPETQPRQMGAWGQGQQSVELTSRKAPASGKHHQKGQPPSQKLSEVRGPKGSAPPPAPSGSGKGSMELSIPSRRECGTLGRKIVVETNYLSLDLSKLQNKIVHHYDIEFEPSVPKRLLRRAFEEFRHKNFPNRYPAFDGKKNLYTSPELSDMSDVVVVHDDESVRGKEFKITIKYAAAIDLESINLYAQSKTSVVPHQSALQALDIVLRSANVSRGCVQVGRSFFTPPTGRVWSLGGGLEMWYGIFQSAILGWKPFLNIDVVHKGFPKPQNVVDAMNEICGPPRAGNELHFRQKEDFVRYIRGLKVDYVLPNNPSSKRIYRVNNIAECPAKLRFEFENNQHITIQEYFSRIKGVTLKYPNIPCLHVGALNREKPIYVPSELCWISKCQVINKKMNEKQTSEMIKSAATPANVRKSKIMDVMQSVRFNEDQCVQEFGISVGGRFEEVDARILNAPQLQYKQTCRSPEDGVWRAMNFYGSASLKSWAILNLDGYTRDEALRNFEREMQRMGRDLGMEIGRPSHVSCMREPTRDTRDLESFFKSMKDNKVDIVFVVVPDRKSCYVKVKQVAELSFGVLTQCIKSRTIQYMKPATCSNILLKVNSKLNGVNHVLAAVSKPLCLTTPAMIVGADVTHPPPDLKNKPSVAAVCASYDPQAFRYNIQIRLQPPRVEIIQDMEAIMREQLMHFYTFTNYKPDRIIFYRDGVSEGQFRQVLENEVTAIRRACTSLNKEYQPMVTFLVVQKRHHTRFFPIKREDEHGKNRNVPPGTIVDTKITHPTELDFFLVSHASIQGTSRPTKYHMLWNDDDDMSTDDLQQLTYYLCHMFSRCTRSVSYPAPTYNAHLAAYRAGVYLDESSPINLTNLAHEQRKYFETAALKKIMEERPMYFV